MVKKNLIVCMTPLHSMIAERIVGNLKEDFDLAYFSSRDLEKSIFYFEKIKDKFAKSFFFKIDSRWSYYKFFLTINSFFGQYNCLYLASVSSPITHIFFNKARYNYIYTYDDGFANILPSSLFKKDEKGLKFLIKKIIGLKTNNINIIASSVKHFTIYKNIKNIFENPVYIDLFDGVEDFDLYKSYKIQIDIKKEISIFLGQPLDWLMPKYNKDKIFEKINFLNFDYYLPHPAENYNFEDKFNVIKTKYIAEDFIKYIKYKNPNANIILYSFTSTSLFNFCETSMVKVYSVYDEELYFDFKDAYDFIIDFGKIGIINSNNIRVVG